MNEGTGSSKSKKKNKKKLKKKKKLEEFDNLMGKWSPEGNRSKKYKSKNRRHSLWVHRHSARPESALWPLPDFFSPLSEHTPEADPSRPLALHGPQSSHSSHTAGTSDWSTGSFPGSPMSILRPDWLNPKNPLPLYGQVF